LEIFVAIDNNSSVSGPLNKIIIHEPEVEQVDINGDFDSPQENDIQVIHLKTINSNLEATDYMPCKGKLRTPAIFD
jgi:hypothetical protein